MDSENQPRSLSNLQRDESLLNIFFSDRVTWFSEIGL
jgi:hypothetical protein